MSQAVDTAATLIPADVTETSVEELLALAEKELDAGYREGVGRDGGDRDWCVRAIALLGTALIPAWRQGREEVIEELKSAAEQTRVARLAGPAGYPVGDQLCRRLHVRFIDLHIANGRRERRAPAGDAFIPLMLETVGEIASGLDAIDGSLLRGPAHR
ncbi:MAG TPA: hypothetical protein VN609_08160 [Propionibacteriaceae bacterium]|nr:hypothetical protein [Propionibacteriaceae bacterium]